MFSNAVIIDAPEQIATRSVRIDSPKSDDVVVQIRYSGISTGTEKLFWSGKMPPFPGMGYPLIPGYEAMGEVVVANKGTGLSVGDHVFVPGATCYGEVRGLFGAAADTLTTAANRVVRIDSKMGPSGALLALAATARHAMAGIDKALPELIVGHGAVGRLLARLTIAAGGAAPTVWETDPARRGGADGYQVVHPDDDTRRDYRCIYDATGDSEVLDRLIARLGKGGELVLAGFYPDALRFNFAPAFMREARLRIAAEWTHEDLIATRDLTDQGALSLDGLISHMAPAEDAAEAYRKAFTDPACLKMILDWEART
ncbi:MAG: chlorophyll synthesis pathway protein BchC [Pseudomonadota bacterium]